MYKEHALSYSELDEERSDTIYVKKNFMKVYEMTFNNAQGDRKIKVGIKKLIDCSCSWAQNGGIRLISVQ